jgi:hypothetical protein
VIVIDASIVNVALPSIGAHLHFSRDDLTWVVNAYTLTFGGLLLLGGRMADLLGRRRRFMLGLVVSARLASVERIVKLSEMSGLTNSRHGDSQVDATKSHGAATTRFDLTATSRASARGRRRPGFGELRDCVLQARSVPLHRATGMLPCRPNGRERGQLER